MAQVDQSPPNPWHAAVAEFARSVQLDADRLLAGERFEVNGVGFWLQQFREDDPDGLVVLLDLGEIPEATAAEVRMRMLENNARTAAALRGYYGIVPQFGRGVYCVRLDRAKVPPSGEVIACLVLTLGSTMESVHASMLAHVDDPLDLEPLNVPGAARPTIH